MPILQPTDLKVPTKFRGIPMSIYDHRIEYPR